MEFFSISFRLMPAIMIIVALFVLLPIAKPFLDGGATWSDIVEKPSKACESYGLINFLFIQNFFSPSESVSEVCFNFLLLYTLIGSIIILVN